MGDTELRAGKRELRRSCFSAVRALGDTLKGEYSDRICEHLLLWEKFQKAKSIGIYIAVKSEPDLSKLIWAHSGKSFALARIDDDEVLHFHQIKSKADLIVGGFGIAEPNPETCFPVEESTLDLVLVPGVGFDSENGARLGRGKGHYDRFLERVRDSTGNQCDVAGVSFLVQHIPIRAEAHDQPMNFLVSEKGIINLL